MDFLKTCTLVKTSCTMQIYLDDKSRNAKLSGRFTASVYSFLSQLYTKLSIFWEG